jgi:hypothetical protein
MTAKLAARNVRAERLPGAKFPPAFWAADYSGIAACCPEHCR